MAKTISDLPATTIGRTTDLFEKTDGVSGESEKITGAQMAVAVNGGAKRYVALMTADGLNPPIVSVMENTLGASVAWTRDTNGIYLGTISGGFDPAKTALFISNNLSGAGATINYIFVDSNQVKIIVVLIATEATTDDVLDNATIRIDLFP